VLLCLWMAATGAGLVPPRNIVMSMRRLRVTCARGACLLHCVCRLLGLLDAVLSLSLYVGAAALHAHDHNVSPVHVMSSLLKCRLPLPEATLGPRMTAVLSTVSPPSPLHRPDNAAGRTSR
jgi:hypothetical protein